MKSRVEKFLAKKKKYLVPCVYHFYKKPMLLERGRGVHVYDDTGRRYLDAYSGVGVVNCGHCHPRIVAAARRQLEALQHTTTIYLTRPMLDLAEALSRYAGHGLKRSFFCASGSEANEGAMRLAKLHTKRTHFLALDESLHGRTHLTTSATGLAFWRTDPDPAATVHFLPSPVCGRCPYGLRRASCGLRCAAEVEKELRRRPGKIAAMIAEPVLGNGGIHPLPRGYLRRVKRALQKYGALLILDEAQSGFGRTGRRFAFHGAGVLPDILTVCKALGNGLPVAAFVATDRVAAAYTRPGASTFGGNPTSAAAALATLGVLRSLRLDRRAAVLGRDLKRRLMSLQNKCRWIREVRGEGLMLGAELADPETGAPASVKLDEVLEALKDDGVLAGKTGKDRNVLTLMPPLVMSGPQARFLAGSIERAFRKAALLGLAVFFAGAMAGCATMPLRPAARDGVTAAVSAVRLENAQDARFSRVKGREFLAFDADLKQRLEEDYPKTGVSAKKEFLARTLDEAKALGDRAAEVELGRLAGGGGPLLERYRGEAVLRLEKEKETVASLSGEKNADRYFRALDGGIESSIKTRGRTLRQVLMLPLAPFVHAWMGLHVLSTPAEEPKAEFSEVDVYAPASAPASSDPASMTDEQLLGFYAPTIAMEKKEKTDYDPRDDRFGRVLLEGADAAHAQPAVDTDDPVVYGYAETKVVQGASVKMLVYTLWFPERPRLGGGFDPEVGSMQGSILRVSLDDANRPVIYENVSSCGCYYKVFPTAAAERRAKEVFGAPLPEKRFSIENKVPGKIDAAVLSLVDSDSAVVAVYSAGAHEVLRLEGRLPAAYRAHAGRAYRLAPYEELESLPFGAGRMSLFDENGLVRSADRLEAALLAPSGIYHAGTPRQRGTLMIYFDQADFDDRHLLETYLRLPEHAFRRT